MASIGRLALTRATASVPKREFSTSLVKNSQSWQQQGIPGSTLPFSIQNRYKLTLVMTLFFASGFNAPFFLVRHQLLKK